MFPLGLTAERRDNYESITYQTAKSKDLKENFKSKAIKLIPEAVTKLTDCLYRPRRRKVEAIIPKGRPKRRKIKSKLAMTPDE